MTQAKPVNSEQLVYPSASRTATPTAVTLENMDHRGCILTVDATTIASTETITPKIEYYDPVSQKWVALLTASAAIAAAGTKAYLIYPGAGAASGGITQVAAFPLPRRIKVTITHSSTGAHVYSVGIQWLV